MQGLFVIMEVNQSFDNLSDDFLASVMINLANQFGQIAIRTVLKNYDKVLLFFEEEELSGLDDVSVFKGNVHLSFFFCIIFNLFTDGDDLECILVFVDRFGKMDLSKSASSKEFEKSVVVDFLKHLFDLVE